MTNYEAAREKYAALGVDTDKAIETLKKNVYIEAVKKFKPVVEG